MPRPIPARSTWPPAAMPRRCMWRASCSSMMAGVELVHVAYRGEPVARPDLLSGQVQVMFGVVPSSLPYIKNGQMRALAVTTEKRLDVLPDVPAMAEFLPGYEASGWYGIAAPKDTPPEIVERLNREINAGLADAKMKARLAELGCLVLSRLTRRLWRSSSRARSDKWAQGDPAPPASSRNRLMHRDLEIEYNAMRKAFRAIARFYAALALAGPAASAQTWPAGQADHHRGAGAAGPDGRHDRADGRGQASGVARPDRDGRQPRRRQRHDRLEPRSPTLRPTAICCWPRRRPRM